MEKIINKLINEFTKGVDTYTHNGSTWLIFTDTKQWVVELTESKTLWYNYNFFSGMFSYVSMDVVDNQLYITKWVENNIINKVKDTIWQKNITEGEVEEIIENGVKHTEKSLQIDGSCVIEDTIQNGVKETMFNQGHKQLTVKNIIENGVRHTLNTEYMPKTIVEDILQNGVKETKTPGNGDLMSYVEWMKEKKTTSYPKIIDDVIENGVKEVQPLPDQSGELIGYSNYYNLKEDRTKPFIDYLEETIKFGVKN